MRHPCIDENCAHWDESYVGPTQHDGVDCYGYMDYNDTTNYWSACSVADFTEYINLQDTFCLETLDISNTGNNSQSCEY